MKIPSITFNQLLVGLGVFLLAVFLVHLFCIDFRWSRDGKWRTPILTGDMH